MKFIYIRKYLNPMQIWIFGVIFFSQKKKKNILLIDFFTFYTLWSIKLSVLRVTRVLWHPGSISLFVKLYNFFLIISWCHNLKFKINFLTVGRSRFAENVHCHFIRVTMLVNQCYLSTRHCLLKLVLFTRNVTTFHQVSL